MTSAKGLRYGDLLHGDRLTGPIQLSNVTDSLYEAMWRRLVNLEFEPGARLSVDALARDFGVSGTPVREALYRLSQVGLVQVNARRGFFVAQLTRQSVEELYDVRTALESFAIKAAAPGISLEDLRPLFAALEAERGRIGASSPVDAEGFVQSDLRLHDLAVSRAGNERLDQTLKDVSGQLAITVLRLALMPEARLRAIEEHARILEALVSGDPRTAADAMEEHIQNVKHRALEEFHF